MDSLFRICGYLVVYDITGWERMPELLKTKNKFKGNISCATWCITHTCTLSFNPNSSMLIILSFLILGWAGFKAAWIWFFDKFYHPVIGAIVLSSTLNKFTVLSLVKNSLIWHFSPALISLVILTCYMYLCNLVQVNWGISCLWSSHIYYKYILVLP